MVAAVLAGITDVDAITLALAGAAGTDLSPGTVAAAIALSVLSNTLQGGVRGMDRHPGIPAGDADDPRAAFAAGLLALLFAGSRQ
jgi:hypothetical protein